MGTLTGLSRVPVAILLALLASVGLGAAIASVDEAEPASMVVAGPADGDRAAYEVTLTGDWKDPFDGRVGEPDWRAPWTAIELAWDQTAVTDADGRHVDAAVLSMVHTGWQFTGFGDNAQWRLDDVARQHAYDAQTLDPIWTSDGIDWSRPGESIEVAGTPVQTRGETVFVVAVVQHADPRDECLFGTGLAGMVLQAGRRIEISCILHATPGVYGANHYVFDHMTVRGIEMLDGQPAMRVGLDALDASAWFVPGIPVPLRIAMDWELDGRAFGLHYDLTGFERGTPFGASKASAPPSVPASGPLQPWGIDTGDSAVVFPAREAYDAMMADGVDGFLDRPGAFVAGAVRTEMELYGTMQRSWVFRLHAGTERWIVDVTEEAPVATDPLPGLLREQARRIEVTVVDKDEACVLLPSDMPAEAPHLQAALQRWRAQGGQGEGNVWGHALVCAADGPLLLVYAGEARLQHLLRERSPDRPGDTSLALATDAISFEASGRVHQHLRAQWGSDGRVGPTTYQESPESSLALPDAGAWITPAQAAAAGIFGIAAGILYWAWPMLKAGPLALFSRLRRHELLDHPHRSAIHDLVMARPGIHFNEMQRTLSLAPGTVRHHVQMMVRQEVLVERPHGRYTCYFVRGQNGRMEMALAATVKSDGATRVVEALRAAPGSTAKDVADVTGLSTGTVAYHVKRLQAQGLLEATREGRSVRLEVA